MEILVHKVAVHETNDGEGREKKKRFFYFYLFFIFLKSWSVDGANLRWFRSAMCSRAEIN